MAVSKSGNDAVFSGNTANTFTDAVTATAFTQNGQTYTINTAAAPGKILLPLTGTNIAALASNNVIQCGSVPQVQNGTSADTSSTTSFVDLSGVTLQCIGSGTVAEVVAGMKANAYTKIVFGGAGNAAPWSSKHVNYIDGATFIYASNGADGHLGFNPGGYVRNVKLVFLQTTATTIILAGQQIWSANKPVSADGLRFISVNGNDQISVFTWTNGNVMPWGGGGTTIPNEAFMVYKDFTYDVALPNNRPTAIRRSYRRASIAPVTQSIWTGIASINVTFLWIDPKTTLSATGVLDSTPTYLRALDYNNTGTVAADNNSDVIAYTFEPTILDNNLAGITNAQIAVRNTNALCNTETKGVFRSKIACAGITGSNGKFVITEPGSKTQSTYVNANAGFDTDSFVIQNRTATSVWHRWWETGKKFIPIATSQGTTGATFGDSYLSSDYQLYIRKPGFMFVQKGLTLDGPKTQSEILVADTAYNSGLSTTGITVSHTTGTTTVSIGAGTFTVDQIYKALQDFHGNAANTQAGTVISHSWNGSKLSFTTATVINTNAATIIEPGSKLTIMETTGTFSFTAGTISNCVLIDSTGTKSRITITGLLNGSVVKIMNGATTVASGTSTGSSLTLNYSLGVGVTSQDVTLYADSANVISVNKVVTLTQSIVATSVILITDNFMTSTTSANATINWSTHTIAIATGDATIRQVYDKVKTEFATIANINDQDYQPETTDGVTYDFKGWNFSTTGTLTGPNQILVTGTAPTLVSNLIINSSVTVSFPANSNIFGVASCTNSFTGKTTLNSNIVNVISRGSNSFYIGQLITGTGIPANATITAINLPNLTISSNATANGTITCSLAMKGSITSGSTTLTLTNTEIRRLYVGQVLVGTGIPAGAFIQNILTATTVRMSAAATATNASASITTTDYVFASNFTSNTTSVATYSSTLTYPQTANASTYITYGPACNTTFQTTTSITFEIGSNTNFELFIKSSGNKPYVLTDNSSSGKTINITPLLSAQAGFSTWSAATLTAITASILPTPTFVLTIPATTQASGTGLIMQINTGGTDGNGTTGLEQNGISQLVSFRLIDNLQNSKHYAMLSICLNRANAFEIGASSIFVNATGVRIYRTNPSTLAALAVSLSSAWNMNFQNNTASDFNPKDANGLRVDYYQKPFSTAVSDADKKSIADAAALSLLDTLLSNNKTVRQTIIEDNYLTNIISTAVQPA